MLGSDVAGALVQVLMMILCGKSRVDTLTLNAAVNDPSLTVGTTRCPVVHKALDWSLCLDKLRASKEVLRHCAVNGFCRTVPGVLGRVATYASLLHVEAGGSSRAIRAVEGWARTHFVLEDEEVCSGVWHTS